MPKPRHAICHYHKSDTPFAVAARKLAARTYLEARRQQRQHRDLLLTWVLCAILIALTVWFILTTP